MSEDSAYRQLQARLPDVWQRLLQGRQPPLAETPTVSLEPFIARVGAEFSNIQGALRTYELGLGRLGDNRRARFLREQSQLDAQLQEAMQRRDRLLANKPPKPNSFFITLIVGYVLGIGTLLVTLFLLFATVSFLLSPDPSSHDVQNWGHLLIIGVITGVFSAFCLSYIVSDIRARKKNREFARALKECEDTMNELAGGGRL